MTFAPKHKNLLSVYLEQLWPKHMAQVAMASCSDSSEAPVDQLYSSLEDYIEASIMLQYNNRS